MRTTPILLMLGSAYAQYELNIAKKSFSDFEEILSLPHFKRQLGTGTDSTNIYSILTYASGGAYYANVTIGTPPQNQVVILDTGSSDLYFDASSASSCRSTTASNSCRGGSFDKSKSKTYQEVDASPAFNTKFGDGSTASGPFGTDTLGIGSVSIANVQFGLAEQVNSTVGYAVGLMGIGYSLNEATQIQYPNVPEVLKDAGVTSSRAYSVYLNDVGYGQGSILFGGVDTSKYTGTLQVLNLLPDPEYGVIFEFITTVTDLSTTVSGKTSTIFSGGSDDKSAFTGRSNAALAVLLDTGSSAWSVPSSTYTQIVKQFSYIDSYRLAPCSYRDSGDSVTLTFGAKIKIQVPISEFLVPLYNATTNEPYIYNTKGDYACRFMISPSTRTSSFLTLGDAILRSMYVVFDLDNGQVGIAQAAVNSTASSIIVKLGASGIAAAVSGAATAAKQTATIAAQVEVTRSFVASSATSPVGTAAGLDAVPTDARPSGDQIPGIYASGGSGGSTTGGTTTTTTTKGSAAGLVVPKFAWGGAASIAWMTVMAVSGAALLW